MRRAATPEALFRDPRQAYYVGRQLVYCCMQPDLYSVLVWGQVDETDAVELAGLLAVQEHVGVAPHASLVQFQRIERADELSVRHIANFMQEHEAAQGKLVTREALVRPSGSVGMMVAGFYEVVQQRFPTRLFTDVKDGLEWLGFGDRTDEWEPIWQHLVDEQQSQAGLVRRLRELLVTHHADLTVAGAATALRVSERTLQRRLGEAGIAFRTELTEARVRAAQNLLLTTDLDIKAIALQVGAASPQSFSQLFRQLTGQTPTEWRQHRRSDETTP